MAAPATRIPPGRASGLFLWSVNLGPAALATELVGGRVHGPCLGGAASGIALAGFDFRFFHEAAFTGSKGTRQM